MTLRFDDAQNDRFGLGLTYRSMVVEKGDGDALSSNAVMDV